MSLEYICNLRQSICQNFCFCFNKFSLNWMDAWIECIEERTRKIFILLTVSCKVKSKAKIPPKNNYTSQCFSRIQMTPLIVCEATTTTAHIWWCTCFDTQKSPIPSHWNSNQIQLLFRYFKLSYLLSFLFEHKFILL